MIPRKTTRPLEVVFCDVKARKGTPKYFAIFIDDFTHHIAVYTMKSIEETKTIFENFIRESKIMCDRT